MLAADLPTGNFRYKLPKGNCHRCKEPVEKRPAVTWIFRFAHLKYTVVVHTWCYDEMNEYARRGLEALAHHGPYLLLL